MEKEIGFTKLSTRGQVVIPKKFREGLEPGTLLAVTRKGDLIIMKKVDVSPWDEFEKLAKKDRGLVRKSKLKEGDVQKIVEKVRRSRKQG